MLSDTAARANATAPSDLCLSEDYALVQLKKGTSDSGSLSVAHGLCVHVSLLLCYVATAASMQKTE